MIARYAELKTPNASDRIALRGVRVRSRLAGLSQRTTIEQTFINLEPRAIEAVYTFPLPEDAAVCGFEVITGDHILTGTIDESDKAIEKYDDAISTGHGAFLLEQERPDVFTVRVGNLKPKQAATIKLSYVCPLPMVDKQIRVTFPTTVAPRYATNTGVDPIEAAMDADALNPPHVLTVPYGLTLEVEVALGRKIQQISSPTHRIDDRAMDEVMRRVTLAPGSTAMDREIVLSIELTKEHEPRVELSSGRPGTSESFLAVTFVPEFDESDLVENAHMPGETVFVLDCSGSMQGQSIAQAMAALSLCLRSMSPGDTFNVCRFGSTFEMMSSEPLVYSQQTLDRAIAYVNSSGDLGGTELMPPLEAILKAKPASGSVRQIILMTDGQVTNEPAVVALARRHRAHNRIFTFGIGPASSQFLVKGLARATGGAAEFITYDERIKEKVLRTFARLSSPMIEDVELDWHGADVQTLAEIPPVFDGDALTLFGRALGTAPKTVALRCKLGGASREWSVPVGHAHEDGGVIATMWARRTIQSIEEVNDIRRGARVPGAELSRERAMLVQLSKDFNLLCSQTSFVAVEHRSESERNEGRPALRRVPVTLAEGWGGEPSLLVQKRAIGGAAPAAMAAPAVLSELASRYVAAPRAGAFSGFIRAIVKPRVPIRYSPMEDPQAKRGEAASEPRSEIDPLCVLLLAQTADGAFALDPDLFALFEGDRKAVVGVRIAVERAFNDAFGDPSVAALVDTVFVVILLRGAFVDQRALWQRSEAKAVRWLATTLGKDGKELETWLAAQQSLVPAQLARSGSGR